MSLDLHQLPKLKLITSLIGVTFLFACFPGKGGLEGAEREIDSMVGRSDIRGFATSFLYSEWPILFGNWQFTLIVLQVILTWTGCYMFFSKYKISTLKDFAFPAIFTLVASLFSAQLWRDSTLFSLICFGLGLTYYSVSSQYRKFPRLLICLGFAFCFIGALFKPIFGILVGLLFVYILQQYDSAWKRTKNIIIFASLVILSIFPYLVDKKLAVSYEMKKDFTEQAPMLYDLTAVYCWGSGEAKNEAKASLFLHLKTGFPSKSVCADFTINTWDNLHHGGDAWIYADPIEKVQNETKMQNLRDNWIQLIVKYPDDWLQAKIPFVTQVLTSGNTFYRTPNAEGFSNPFVSNINNTLWSTFLVPVVLMDQLKVFSLFTLFIVFVFLLSNRLFVCKEHFNIFLNREGKLISLFVYVNLCIFLQTIAFLANNGRYHLPYTLIVYLLLYLEIRGSRQTEMNNKKEN